MSDVMHPLILMLYDRRASEALFEATMCWSESPLAHDTPPPVLIMPTDEGPIRVTANGCLLPRTELYTINRQHVQNVHDN